MTFAVLVTHDAAHDLDELYDYIAQHDTPEKADHVRQKFRLTTEAF